MNTVVSPVQLGIQDQLAELKAIVEAQGTAQVQVVDAQGETTASLTGMTAGIADMKDAIDMLERQPNTVIVHTKQVISAVSQVLAANENRVSAVVQCDGEVWLGGAANGVKVQSVKWSNTAALTLEPVAGSIEVRILEEAS